jgi:hypothetical protein
MTEIESLFNELNGYVNRKEKRQALEIIDLILREDNLHPQEKERVEQIYAGLFQ